MKMSQLLQSSVWRLILLNIAPKFMVLFGINVFYPKASQYFDKVLRQLVSDHKQNRKFGNIFTFSFDEINNLIEFKNYCLQLLLTRNQHIICGVNIMAIICIDCF